MLNMNVAAQGLSTTLNLVSKNFDSLKSDSYIEFSKMTLVEAPTVVDATIAQLPQTPAILQSCINQFAVYYIQAATIHMNIGRVNINKILDPLNPKRDPGASFFSTLAAGLESFDVLGNENYEEPAEAPGLLSFDGGLNTLNGVSHGLEDINIEMNLKGGDGGGLSSAGRDIVKDAVNLSVGKVISLEVIQGENKASIPITIRLRTGVMQTQPLTTLLSVDQNQNRGFFTRLKKVGAGELSFWRDFVACRDLVEEHRDALLKDTTGMYAERVKTARKNKLSAVASMQPSIANLSAVYVISQETIENLAAYKRIDFSRTKVRKKIFEVTGAMIIAVVNTRWESVTFWRHSIEEPAEFTFSQINKEFQSPKDTNLQEVMRTMGLLNNANF